jgi:hypothetical protein
MAVTDEHCNARLLDLETLEWIQAEWRQFFPGSPYRLTCPQWPSGS